MPTVAWSFGNYLKHFQLHSKWGSLYFFVLVLEKMTNAPECTPLTLKPAAHGSRVSGGGVI